MIRNKLAFILLCLSCLLAACAAEPPIPTPTPSPTALPPSATREFRLIPSWTPTVSPLPSATATPRPTATPNLTLRPYLTAQPNYTPHSGQGIATPDPLVSLTWLDRFSFASEDQPILLFQLHYDPATWQLEPMLTPGGVGYQLVHRLNQGCTLSQTTGGNATADMTVEYQDQTLGNTAYYIGEAALDDELAFVTYCTSYADTPTCFIAYPGESERRCLAEIEGMLAGVTFLTNPRYTTAPNLWACRDEQNNPGLCQISFTLPLNAISLPATQDGWAVGEEGLILRRDGDAWQRESSPATTTLYDVAFLDNEHGWAAGLGGLILEWDGQSWAVQLPYTAPDDAVDGASRAFYALDFSALDDGWAAGGTAYPDGHIESLLMHWNGQRWLPVADLPACQDCALHAVLALNSTDVWAAGGSLDGALLWHWDGSQWSSFSAPGATWLYDLAQGDGTLWTAGITQAQTSAGATVSRGAVLRFDGLQWTPLSLPPNSGGLYTLAYLAPGMLVTGGDNTLLYASGIWSYIATEIAAYGWITDLEINPDGRLYALTSSGFLFELVPMP